MISCVVCAFLWLFSFTALQAPSALSGAVEDETKQPVPGVQVTLHSGAAIQLTPTNEAGRFRFDSLPAGDYSLDFDKAGFFRLTNHTVTAGTPSTEIIVTMNHESEFISQFEALGKRVRIDEGDVSNIDLTLIPSMWTRAARLTSVLLARHDASFPARLEFSRHLE